MSTAPSASNADPIARFHVWWNEAKAHPHIKDSTAMTLATVSREGRPSARIVLLKEADERGFVFFSNAESRKGVELKDNAAVSLCFYWMPLGKQIRVEGVAAQVSVAEADAYFASRPRESRIGAWASQQSRALSDRKVLLQRVEDYTRQFEDRDIPRPPYWTGWRVKPEIIEFWQDEPFRLHDRDIYRKAPKGWTVEKLYP